MTVMRLESPHGDALTLELTGDQFPNAADPAQRFSWHLVAGESRYPYGTWAFRWQALACDESARVPG